MNNKILLSICIQTYNRAEYLKICLDSLVRQFSDEEVFKKTQIIILDNGSTDNTAEVVRAHQEKYPNIKYLKNPKNIYGSKKNLVKFTASTDGSYIWFFSDDDIHKEDSLKTVIRAIEKDNPGIIYCNLDTCDVNGNIRTTNYLKPTNCLRLKRDVLLPGRKEFFSFLADKFYWSINWYTGFVSIFIIKKELFDNNLYIIDQYNGPLDPYLIQYVFYYTELDCPIKIIAKPIVICRGGNTSWGPKGTLESMVYFDKLIYRHYKNILKLNKKYLPLKFKINVYIKNLLVRKIIFILYKLNILK